MKKQFAGTVALIALVLCFFAVAAEEPAAGGAQEGSTPTLGPVRFFTDKPAAQKGWDAVFAGFKEKTGIEVEMTGYTEIDTYIASIKTGITSRQGPDVFTWWSNFKIADLAAEGLLEDVTDIFDDLGAKYSPGLLKSFTYEDRIYGAPLMINAWIMFYNKPVFESLGLQAPNSWNEFMDVCEALKAQGITPIAFTIDGGWTSFFWFQQILASNYPQAYYDILEGRKSWKSEEVVKTFELWKQFFDRGYFSDPGISLGEELPAMFAKGEVGMSYCGDWFTGFFDTVELKGGEDYSIFVVPPYIESRPKTVIYEVGPLCISANAQNKEAARMFVEYWLSEEGQEAFSRAMGVISANADVPGDFLDPVKKKISAEVFGDKDAELIVRFWEATLETITLPACAAFDKFVLDPASYMEVVEELDRLSSTAWAEHKAK